MVEWKGNITEESGTKANRLDSLEGFNVPNFFVITSKDVKQLFNRQKQPERILNTSVDERMKEEIKEAYEDVGMSSEVRKASGRAKSLVGGQRNNQFVSIRVSESGKEKYAYKLNVGSSNFFDSLKEVVSSYCSQETGFPSVIVQKMVEPGHTATLENHGNVTVVESVQGLGISLEEGLTEPSTYIMRRGRVKDSFAPDEQLEISRNPVHGDNQRKKVSVDGSPFEKSEIESLAKKASRRDVNIKFVYKRGSFHVVDAYEAVSDQDPVITDEGIRASKGEIRGRVGREVAFSDQTLKPEEFQKALIARKGGYTSRDGYRIRESGKSAVFQFEGDLQDGRSLDMGPEQVSLSTGSSNSSKVTAKTSDKTDSRSKEFNPFKNDSSSEDTSLASEILPVDPRIGKGVFIERSSDQGYVVTDRPTEATQIPESGYISSYQDFFSFKGDKAVVDVRTMDLEGLENAFEYLKADIKVLVVSEPSRKVIRSAVQNGFEVLGVPEEMQDDVADLVASEEKKFIMDRLRELE